MLARKWALNDPLPVKADFVVCISFGSTSEYLTIGSTNVMNRAYDIAHTRHCPVYWGVFSENPVGGSGHEIEVKARIFNQVGSVFVGNVSSTTEECEAIREYWNIHIEGEPTTIVVVTDGAHSRRARIVWKHFFPNTDIRFRSIPAESCADLFSPMRLQRGWRRWLLFNIIFTPLYKYRPGVAWIAKHNFHQPTV